MMLIVIWPIFFDVTIMFYSLWYFGWELFYAIVLADGSSVLHLMGAFVGFGAGVLYVKKGWVNCENWDLFAVMKGTYGRYGDENTTVGSHADPSLLFGKDVAVSDIATAEVEESARRKLPKRGSMIEKIYGMIDRGQMMEAAEEMISLRMQDSYAQLDEPHLKRLAAGLLKAEMPDDAEIYLEEYVERFPDECAWARARLAQILVALRKRPNAALQQLKQVRLSQLNHEQQSRAKKIASEAKRQVKAGIKDAEPDW